LRIVYVCLCLHFYQSFFILWLPRVETLNGWKRFSFLLSPSYTHSLSVSLSHTHKLTHIFSSLPNTNTHILSAFFFLSDTHTFFLYEKMPSEQNAVDPDIDIDAFYSFFSYSGTSLKTDFFSTAITIWALENEDPATFPMFQFVL